MTRGRKRSGMSIAALIRATLREPTTAWVGLVRDRLEEEAHVDPLADQPPLHVGECRDDGVDGAGFDFLGKRAQAQ